jgi:hypothetical protein
MRFFFFGQDQLDKASPLQVLQDIYSFVLWGFGRPLVLQFLTSGAYWTLPLFGFEFPSSASIGGRIRRGCRL